MSVKTELRKAAKAERKSIPEKHNKSKEIIDKLTSSSLYKDASTILCYASLDDEVCTDLLMQRVLCDNKTLALPRCIDDNGVMEFYVINSAGDLSSGSFGVREPDVEQCKMLECFYNSIIIVPALCYDKRGYRLGYGKGYYDRFLQKHSLISVGLCYNSLIKNEIPIDRYDLPVDYIITEAQFIACDNGGKNGKFE